MVTTPTNASRRPFWAGFLLAVLTACNGGPGDVNGGMRRDMRRYRWRWPMYGYPVGLPRQL
jgi:hypothetical protein